MHRIITFIQAKAAIPKYWKNSKKLSENKASILTMGIPIIHIIYIITVIKNAFHIYMINYTLETTKAYDTPTVTKIIIDVIR